MPLQIYIKIYNAMAYLSIIYLYLCSELYGIKCNHVFVHFFVCHRQLQRCEKPVKV